MKKVKFLMMAVATIMLIGFVGCNNDVVAPNNGDDDINGNLEDVYLSVNLSIPNDAASASPRALRAATDLEDGTDGIEAGTGNEIVVSRVDLYFFQGGNYVNTMSFTSGASELPGSVAQGSNQLISSVTKGIALIVGTYQVYTLVNHTPITTLTVGDPVADLLEASLNPLATFANGFVPLTSTGLPMAGRTTKSGDRIPPVDITIATANNVITNPATLKFEAERSVAKLVLNPTTDGLNKYTITNDGTSGGTTIATAELEEYAVVNLMNTGFAFRHAVPVASVYDLSGGYLFGNVTTDIHYIMDPATHLKTIPVASSTLTLATTYSQHVSAARNYKAMTTSTNHVIGYPYENTTSAESQKNGYSTGLVFKMKITPEEILELNGSSLDPVSDVSLVTNFFYYGGLFYTDLDAIVSKMGMTDAAEITTFKGLSAADLKKIGIETLTGGYCYYNYWIKHLDDDVAATMGVMEFGIVRNNLYRMSVTGVRAIGSGTDVIDPELDNEVALSYLNVEMSILPWIVRSNEGIVL